MNGHNSNLIELYNTRTSKSAALYETAKRLFPGGVTHDARYILPHPIYVQSALGSRKTDVDGHGYVDYQGGHGALLLGHNHPEVMARVADQLSLGTHYGAAHELEIQWAQLITDMIPSAERVRFTSSGTEATLMAIRLARAATGRQKILRLRGHFHGWHDHVAFGVSNHFDGSPTPGVLPGLASEVVLVTPNDVEGLALAVEEHGASIAAAFLEATGSTYGQVPLNPAFVSLLRQLTTKAGILLVFDEVVTGFRVAKGGAQEALGITPDLTTLAKVVAGGLPGGAVAGRKDVLDLLDPAEAKARGVEKIAHQGTYNANPVSAAAGIATLSIIRDTDAIARAQHYASMLRNGVRSTLANAGVAWGTYGTHTGLHIYVNPDERDIDPSNFDVSSVSFDDFKRARSSNTTQKLRIAMRVFGVDISGWPGGLCSAAHTEEDLEQTLTALRRSIQLLREEGDIR